jgi:hypothetical protein
MLQCIFSVLVQFRQLVTPLRWLARDKKSLFIVMYGILLGSLELFNWPMISSWPPHYTLDGQRQENFIYNNMPIFFRFC